MDVQSNLGLSSIVITLIHQFPYISIFLLLILGSLGLPFPEDAVLILSGVLISQDVLKLLPTILVVYTSLLLTDCFLFLMGKKYGRKIVENRRFQKYIPTDRFSKLEKRFNKFSSLTLFFGRHLLGLRAQIFIIAGVMKMSTLKFIVIDGFSALITIGLMVGIGYMGSNSVHILKKGITNGQQIMTIFVLALIISVVTYSYFKSKLNE